jgi:uncharacterized protein YbjT (DUF2867 family)
MVGQGVLRECLRDAEIARVLAVGRSTIGQRHGKLHELLVKSFSDFTTVEADLTGYDTCFFCLGITSAGLSEAEYRRVTYDIALAAAGTLVKLNPGMTFIFVSGAGADRSGKSRVMWARVKGETENALLALPFKGVYVVRPAAIRPLHGIRSKTAWINAAYLILGPFYPVLNALFPNYVTTTEIVGRAMIKVARNGDPLRVLENKDINRAAGETPRP